MTQQDQQGGLAGVTAEQKASWKREAARAAVATIPDGAIVGLGTGSTADLMLDELAARVRAGLRVTGVPTSEHTRQQATALGIPIAELDGVETLTVSIDGADEVSVPQLNLIKGRGGALLHEKLVAAASRFRIIVVDATKLVPVLASTHPVPVEVVPFGWRHTAGRLVALGARPVLRVAPGEDAANPQARPYVTDGGSYLLDCAVSPLYQPEALAAYIKAITGVVEHGLFVSMTDRVYVGGPQGVQVYNRPA
ncbi:MAG TPA: ribose-5-phosphate isomerase RpiA [Ktedonobacterales bacterium]|nr:ribose-5-phosphate isomerase RpiA [Ktedonobacterales bacterium]